MSAACGQSGNHSPHTYQNGTITVKDPVTKQPTQVPKMVLCNGKDN